MSVKKIVLPMAVAGFIGAAHAQSTVTLYGTIDSGIQYLSHASSDGNASIGMQSGNSIPSRWGLTGSEDLGGGLWAYFKIENGFLENSGSMTVPGDLFSRFALVGLKGPWGSVELGKQPNLMFAQTLTYDATYMAQYSLLSTYLMPLATVFLQNSVAYRSPDLHGLSGAAMYSFGQQVAGDFRAGKYLGLSAAYTQGAASVRAVYEETHGSVDTATGISAAGAVDRRASVAAKYAVGDLTLMSGYANVSGDLQLSPRGNLYWAGGTYNFTPAFSMLTQAMRYETSGGQGHPTWAILGSIYRLSVRTFVYGYAGYLDNQGAKTVSLNSLDPSQPGGMNQTGVQIGINHSF
ncbi:Outer membrane protein (porin) [Burkholderia sp. D7]|nr:Outer membrane protein (porin) [Burkholderia sp. D7]